MNKLWDEFTFGEIKIKELNEEVRDGARVFAARHPERDPR